MCIFTVTVQTIMAQLLAKDVIMKYKYNRHYHYEDLLWYIQCSLHVLIKCLRNIVITIIMHGENAENCRNGCGQ